MKTVFVLLFSLSLFGQAVTPQPSNIHQLFYSGSNLQYDCQAPANVPVTSVKVSDSSLTSIVVSSNVGTITTLNANGAWVGMIVTVTGSTTAALNGSYKVTGTTSSTAYTVTTSGVSDGTYANSTLIISTSAPILTSAVWSITVLQYTSSTLTGVYLAGQGSS